MKERAYTRCFPQIAFNLEIIKFEDPFKRRAHARY